jgi:rod shape determining protein RodA
VDRGRWHFDPPLLGGLLLLCLTSLALIYSAGGENSALLSRQLVRILVAFLVLGVVAQIPPDALQRWSTYLYLVGLLALLLVLGIGYVGKGAQRWLDLGFFRFQPAEIMKLAVPILAATILTRKSLPPGFREVLLAVAITLAPVLLIAMQPDLGTAILIAFSGLAVIFLAGLRWSHVAVVVGVIAAAAPFLWNHLHAYQQRRIITLVDPWTDPLGAGYHTIQSIIAIGSGGLTGKGWLAGSQSQLGFIPERSTDFIFSVYAEEFGLLGGLVLLLVYLFLITRSFVVSYNASDSFSRLLTGSLALTFFFYLFVNVGMVSGLLPVVGVPLPLISYGGTSMVTLMTGFGIIMSVHTRKRLMT